MQRLFSTFPFGLPGVGLALLRAATAIPLALSALQTSAEPGSSVVEVVMACASAFLLVGFWTPLAGGVIALVELWRAAFHPLDPWMHLHFAVLSAGLTLLGPGGYSADAHLFGRKRIHIPWR